MSPEGTTGRERPREERVSPRRLRSSLALTCLWGQRPGGAGARVAEDGAAGARAPPPPPEGGFIKRCSCSAERLFREDRQEEG